MVKMYQSSAQVSIILNKSDLYFHQLFQGCPLNRANLLVSDMGQQIPGWRGTPIQKFMGVIVRNFEIQEKIPEFWYSEGVRRQKLKSVDQHLVPLIFYGPGMVPPYL